MKRSHHSTGLMDGVDGREFATERYIEERTWTILLFMIYNGFNWVPSWLWCLLWVSCHTLSLQWHKQKPDDIIMIIWFGYQVISIHILCKITWLMKFIRIGGRKVIVKTLNMSLVRATVTLHTEMSLKNLKLLKSIQLHSSKLTSQFLQSCPLVMVEHARYHLSIWYSPVWLEPRYVTRPGTKLPDRSQKNVKLQFWCPKG